MIKKIQFRFGQSDGSRNFEVNGERVNWMDLNVKLSGNSHPRGGREIYAIVLSGKRRQAGLMGREKLDARVFGERDEVQ